MTLSRTFVLRNPDVIQAMKSFIDSNALEMARQDRPLAVKVSEYHATRKEEHANYYFKRVGEIAQQAWVDGKQYHKDTWHEWLKNKFAPRVQGPGGEPIAKSTKQMTTPEMTEYVGEVEAFAAQEYGVRFSERAA